MNAQRNALEMNAMYLEDISRKDPSPANRAAAAKAVGQEPYGWDCGGVLVKTALTMKSYKRDGVNPVPLFAAPVPSASVQPDSGRDAAPADEKPELDDNDRESLVMSIKDLSELATGEIEALGSDNLLKPGGLKKATMADVKRKLPYVVGRLRAIVAKLDGAAQPYTAPVDALSQGAVDDPREVIDALIDGVAGCFRTALDSAYASGSDAAKAARKQFYAATGALKKTVAIALAQRPASVVQGGRLQGDDAPVAQVAEDCVFLLRKQPNGERWPVGTKLYARPILTAQQPKE